MSDSEMPLIYSELETNQYPLIYKKISLVMGEVSPIAKDKVAMGYKFRGIDDIYQALQHILSKHGVFTVPEVLEERSEERTSSKGGLLIYRILKIKYTFYAEDGSSVQAVVIGEGMDSGDKASNKAMSVAQKYALLQVFCIPTAEPKDPEIDSHEVAKGKIDSRGQSAPLNVGSFQGIITRVIENAKFNGWDKESFAKYLNQKYSTYSLENLNNEQLEQVNKAVSNYKPKDILKD